MPNTVNSKRGEGKFMHNGYSYIYDRKSSDGTKKFWRYELKNECKARIHTNMDETSVFKMINNHSHGSDPSKIAVDIIRANIREQALQTTEIL
ncbi:hypothetical protein MXB_1811 [Myxobolus squamalis]|nr:hypothetical protein MXB_1811 [Myxobolus squamalis]